MGVMACSVSSCPNIMCDRCDGSRYICNDCFERLVGMGVQIDLEEFFRTPPPNSSSDNAEATRRYYDSLFPTKAAKRWSAYY